MTIGTWDPGARSEPTTSVAADLMQKFVALGRSIDESVTATDLEAAGVSGESWVMAAAAGAWEEANTLENEDLIGLAKFFTLVEQQVAGWDAGKTSPVIPLVKILKTRDAFTPELRKWIKKNTDNRYLPHGSAL